MLVRSLLGAAATLLFAAGATGFWAEEAAWLVDVALGTFMALPAFSPRLAKRVVPVQGHFQWAGARGEGAPAPPGSDFKYPLRPEGWGS